MLIRNDYCYKARDLLRRILIPDIVTISSYVPNEIMDIIKNYKLFVVAEKDAKALIFISISS